ncbi:hypothetical protein YPPY03_4958, partial [Yersinia pestis PY-03]
MAIDEMIRRVTGSPG